MNTFKYVLAGMLVVGGASLTLDHAKAATAGCVKTTPQKAESGDGGGPRQTAESGDGGGPRQTAESGDGGGPRQTAESGDGGGPRQTAESDGGGPRQTASARPCT